MIFLTCTMKYIEQSYNFTSNSKGHQSPSKTSSFTFRLTIFYLLICRLLFAYRYPLIIRQLCYSRRCLTEYIKQNNKKYPSLPHFFISTAWRGSCFSGRCSRSFIEQNFYARLNLNSSLRSICSCCN